MSTSRTAADMENNETIKHCQGLHINVSRMDKCMFGNLKTGSFFSASLILSLTISVTFWCGVAHTRYLAEMEKAYEKVCGNAHNMHDKYNPLDHNTKKIQEHSTTWYPNAWPQAFTSGIDWKPIDHNCFVFVESKLHCLQMLYSIGLAYTMATLFLFHALKKRDQSYIKVWLVLSALIWFICLVGQFLGIAMLQLPAAATIFWTIVILLLNKLVLAYLWKIVYSYCELEMASNISPDAQVSDVENVYEMPPAVPIRDAAYRVVPPTDT